MVTPQQPTLDYLRATPTVPTLYTATSHLINNISDENTNTTATKLLWQPMKDNIMLNTTTTCLAAKQRIRLNLLAHQKKLHHTLVMMESGAMHSFRRTGWWLPLEDTTAAEIAHTKEALKNLADNLTLLKRD